jgi:hypothetical protein
MVKSRQRLGACRFPLRHQCSHPLRAATLPGISSAHEPLQPTLLPMYECPHACCMYLSKTSNTLPVHTPITPPTMMRINPRHSSKHTHYKHTPQSLAPSSSHQPSPCRQCMEVHPLCGPLCRCFQPLRGADGTQLPPPPAYHTHTVPSSALGSSSSPPQSHKSSPSNIHPRLIHPPPPLKKPCPQSTLTLPPVRGSPPSV